MLVISCQIEWMISAIFLGIPNNGLHTFVIGFPYLYYTLVCEKKFGIAI